MVVTLLAVTPAVRAQPTVSEEAVAETLFREATVLIQEGDYAEACPKLEASHRADPAGGTALLLAICYEQTGRTASAWLRFNEARAMARADRRQDREARANEHLVALEPRLSFVTVVVAESERALPGYAVEVDGAPLPLVGTTSSFPVDPGEHVVRVSASGKHEWSGSVAVTGEGERSTVTVPELVDLPPASQPVTDDGSAVTPAPLSSTEAADRSSRRRPGATQRRLAYAVGFVGLATAGLGAYYGVRALDREEESELLCPEPTCTSEDGVNLSEEAFANADRANVLIGGGAALIVTAAVLHLTAPRPRPRSAPVALTVAPRGLGLGLRGAF